MAFVATVIGFVIPLPIAGLAANNLAVPVAMSSRVVLAALRNTKHNLGIDFHYCDWFGTIWCFSDDPLYNWISLKCNMRP